MDFEEARKIMKREAKNPSKYNVNRMAHMVREVGKTHGQKASSELMTETMSVRKRKFKSQAER